MVARPDEVISFASLHTLGINFFPLLAGRDRGHPGQAEDPRCARQPVGCVEALISGSCDVMLCYSHPGVQMSLTAPASPQSSWRRTASCRSARRMRMAAGVTIWAGPEPCHNPCYSPESFLVRLVTPLVEAQGLNERLIFHYENSMAEALKPAALAGAGVAWLPELAIRDELGKAGCCRSGRRNSGCRSRSGYTGCATPPALRSSGYGPMSPPGANRITLGNGSTGRRALR